VTSTHAQPALSLLRTSVSSKPYNDTTSWHTASTPCDLCGGHSPAHITFKRGRIIEILGETCVKYIQVCYASHVTHHTSHVTSHTSHIKRHTSNVTHHLLQDTHPRQPHGMCCSHSHNTPHSPNHTTTTTTHTCAHVGRQENNFCGV
jgi:hypothetical protein